MSEASGRQSLQLVAFAALSAFAALRWASLLTDPPVGRALLAALAVIAGAAALLWLRRESRPQLAVILAAVVIALAALALAAIALGVPARLLSPLHWGRLATVVGNALAQVANADYPYTGSAVWPRLVIMLGLPLMLCLAGILAFWPSRAGTETRWLSYRRLAALGLIVTAYGIAATLSPPDDKLLNGLILFALIGAWLWLPRLPRGAVPPAAFALALAGLLALPLSDGLDGARPLLNYRDWTTSKEAETDFFNWNQTYGPIDWPRTGRTMLVVHSDSGPHYWRAAVLDRFDGFRWLMTQGNGTPALELPTQVEPGDFSILNQSWKHRITFDVKALSSPFIVGAGSLIGVLGADDTEPTANGVVLQDNKLLSDGDSYSVIAYTPQPTVRAMRDAPAGYPRSLSRFTTIDLPVGGVSLTIPPPPDTRGNQQPPGVLATIEPVQVPLRGSGSGHRSLSAEEIASAPSAQAQRMLKLPRLRQVAIEMARSPYEHVYRLARRLTAGAGSNYAAVLAIQDYLKTKYTYSEAPPRRTIPLRAFLFRDRIGYCQQFSGAMALMLRMAGIPARVASGFSPGRPTKHGFIVRELDAHAWVEVYFRGIGWVPFDPTPAAAPAASRSAIGGGDPSLSTFTHRQGPKIGTGLTVRGPLPGSGDGGGGPPLWVPALVLLGLLLAAAAVIALRGRRARALAPAERLELALSEFEAALRRLRRPVAAGATLLSVERELRGRRAGTAADYAAGLREARFAPDCPEPPSPAERRRLRHALTAGGGLRRRLQGWRMLPPGGPLA